MRHIYIYDADEVPVGAQVTITSYEGRPPSGWLGHRGDRIAGRVVKRMGERYVIEDGSGFRFTVRREDFMVH